MEKPSIPWFNNVLRPTGSSEGKEEVQTNKRKQQKQKVTPDFSMYEAKGQSYSPIKEGVYSIEEFNRLLSERQ